MEGKSFEIDVFVDEKITCQLFRCEEKPSANIDGKSCSKEKIRTERPKDPLDSARGRVHLYSSRDIERATDGRKEYYKFWNSKAQELCSDPHFNNYRKQELHGVIDTAWQMRSCEILTAKVEAELQNMSESKPGSSNKTVTKNIERVKEAKRVANELNRQIRQLKQQWNVKGGKAVKGEVIQKEEKLSDAMT
ncbi:unnamed protein product, partial [Porites lobata]